MSELVVVVLVGLVAVCAGLLWYYAQCNQMYGKQLANQPNNAARNRHRISSTKVLIAEGLLVVVVLALETQVRSDSNYIAPFTPLLMVHLVFAITYALTTLAMKFWATGKRYLTQHIWLGKNLAPLAFNGMLATGAVLLAQILYTL